MKDASAMLSGKSYENKGAVPNFAADQEYAQSLTNQTESEQKAIDDKDKEDSRLLAANAEARNKKKKMNIDKEMKNIDAEIKEMKKLWKYIAIKGEEGRARKEKGKGKGKGKCEDKGTDGCSCSEIARKYMLNEKAVFESQWKQNKCHWCTKQVPEEFLHLVQLLEGKKFAFGGGWCSSCSCTHCRESQQLQLQWLMARANCEAVRANSAAEEEEQEAELPTMTEAIQNATEAEVETSPLQVDRQKILNFPTASGPPGDLPEDPDTQGERRCASGKRNPKWSYTGGRNKWRCRIGFEEDDCEEALTAALGEGDQKTTVDVFSIWNVDQVPASRSSFPVPVGSATVAVAEVVHGQVRLADGWTNEARASLAGAIHNNPHPNTEALLTRSFPEDGAEEEEAAEEEAAEEEEAAAEEEEEEAARTCTRAEEELQIYQRMHLLRPCDRSPICRAHEEQLLHQDRHWHAPPRSPSTDSSQTDVRRALPSPSLPGSIPSLVPSIPSLVPRGPEDDPDWLRQMPAQTYRDLITCLYHQAAEATAAAAAAAAAEQDEEAEVEEPEEEGDEEAAEGDELPVWD